jgi:hypothetical protein
VRSDGQLAVLETGETLPAGERVLIDHIIDGAVVAVPEATQGGGQYRAWRGPSPEPVAAPATHEGAVASLASAPEERDALCG